MSIVRFALTLLVVAPAAASGAQHEEVRNLALNAQDVASLAITAGAGSLTVTAEDELPEIQVQARVRVDGSREKAQAYIAEALRLSLEKSGRGARLLSELRYHRGNAHIELKVALPSGLALTIRDGSGSIDIRGTRASVTIQDGSGSIELHEAGDVEISDGSGSIQLSQVDGDVHISDGSGSIDVHQVTGSVHIADGSGSISVREVVHDLIISNDGSGGVRYANIGGRIVRN